MAQALNRWSDARGTIPWCAGSEPMKSVSTCVRPKHCVRLPSAGLTVRKMVALKPPMTEATRSCAAMLYSCSWLSDSVKIQSSENSRFRVWTDFYFPDFEGTITSPRVSEPPTGLRRA